jgi:hypothetical protein
MNVEAILAVSHRNNARDGLTGALAAHENRYIQVIEGPPAALDGLLGRLADDPRHRDIVVFGREPVEARMFADWTMASARITPELTTVLDDLMREATPSPERTITALLAALAVT